MAAALALASCKTNEVASESANFALRAKDSGKDRITLRLEVADNNEARLQGFQNRESVPAGTGMLFVFDGPDYHAMWMKNTLVPLDMIFLNNDKVVTSIAHDRVPLTLDYITPCNTEYEKASKAGKVDEGAADAFFDECEGRFMKPEMLTRYVIEVPAGTAAKYGVRPGDVLVKK
jgi:uncharacterized membrane protein (UPF0127 family)